MSQLQFAIKKVVVTGATTLAITFRDGFVGHVDLAAMIARHPTLKRLRDPKVFANVARDEWHLGIVFAGDDALSMAGDNLRNLAIEQAGGVGHARVIEWMWRNGLTLEAAADALGISRRMLAYYRSGEKPIPKTVGLAMLGWETVQTRKAA